MEATSPCPRGHILTTPVYGSNSHLPIGFTQGCGCPEMVAHVEFLLRLLRAARDAPPIKDRKSVV